MNYYTTINNIKAIEWGLTIQQAYLFSWIYELPSWATKCIIGEDVYYFASKNKTIKELPILTDKVDTIYRYYKQLEALELIKVRKIDNMDYICLTSKGMEWNKYKEDNKNTLGKKSEHSEKNPNTRKEIQMNSEKNPNEHSEKNPTYNSNNINTLNNNYNTTKNNYLHACENSQGATLKTVVALSQELKTSTLETELLNTPPVASPPPSLKKEKKDKPAKWWHKHLNELKAPFEDFSKKAFGCGIKWDNGLGTKKIGELMEQLELSVYLSDETETGKVEFFKTVLKSLVAQDGMINKRDYWEYPKKGFFLNDMNKLIKSVHSVLESLKLAKENAYIFKNGFVDAKTEQRNENLKKIQQAEINLINQINSL